MALSRTTRRDRQARGVCPTHPDRPVVEGRPWCAECLSARRQAQETHRQAKGRRSWTPPPQEVGALLEALAGPLTAYLTAQEQLWVDAWCAKVQRTGGLEEAYAQLAAHLHATAQGRQALAAAQAERR